MKSSSDEDGDPEMTSSDENNEMGTDREWIDLDESIITLLFKLYLKESAQVNLSPSLQYGHLDENETPIQSIPNILCPVSANSYSRNPNVMTLEFMANW